MSILNMLSRTEIWEEFLTYKKSLTATQYFIQELEEFVKNEGYLSVCDKIAKGCKFPIPKKSVISKMSTEKKRVVYTYPYEENMVLKLLTYLLLRKYDDLFSQGLYSFRPGRNAKDAIRYLLRKKNLGKMYAYKVDIHDYFNSVSVDQLLPMLKSVLEKEEETYSFLESLLLETQVRYREEILEENKGIMAGTPLSAFYANLYLIELDHYFQENGILYCRYSDDIIVFGESMEQTEEYAQTIREFLAFKDLEINPKKECFYTPEEGFQFLGFMYQEGNVDISPVTLRKMKKKMKRKRDALARWAKRKDVDNEKAAKAFIRIFNQKLLENPTDHELSWAHWFFPVITTTKSLKEIDHYAQDCIRYLISGKHTKARYNVRYDHMKELGYRSMVHEYFLKNI